MALAVMLATAVLTIPASAAGETLYGIGFVNATSLRLRSQPDLNSSTLAQAPNGDCVVVVSKEGSWYKVIYNLQEGYMHESYLTVLTKENAELGYGKITGDSVNLRSGPSTANGSVAVADYGETCYILGLNEGWYKVLYDGLTCYVRSDFLELTEIPYENQASPNSPKYYRHGKAIGSLPSGTTAAASGEVSDSSTEPVYQASGSEILAEAQQYLGTPYVNGGASPSGFDCSGFVYYVLKQCGYTPYRTPADQYRQGTSVDKASLQPGDIVFFAGTYASGISHVGIYAGNGQFIHAPNSRSTVSYSDLTSGYWAEHYYGARRVG